MVVTAPDVRTAAQAEAEATANFGQPDFSAPNDRTIKWATYVQAFGAGAVWGAALVTPTREQIAEAVAEAQNVPFVGRKQERIADAVLALLAGGDGGAD